jgi:hypothetical protein
VPRTICSRISSATISGTPWGIPFVSTTIPRCSCGSSTAVVDAPDEKAPECDQRRKPRWSVSTFHPSPYNCGWAS